MSTKKPISSQTYAFRCPKRLAEKMDTLCEKFSLDRTALIKLALQHFLDRIEKQNGELFPQIIDAKPSDYAPITDKNIWAAEEPSEYNLDNEHS